VLGSMYGSCHLTVPAMNGLDQTEPATFTVLLFWTFFIYEAIGKNKNLCKNLSQKLPYSLQHVSPYT
jgi:hypothetical protein